ncbi:MAG: CDP-diacylglycerol--serine O-phosphatidyltransferase [Clostridia bacterium]|nr:CDP-diacylglycerol--serine O-phosphatidyltransferase [Clostridia bacterium]
MKRIKSNLPNILTLINLSLGVLAILFAVSNNSSQSLLINACFLVMVAALTDRFDGKVARMLDATSDFGKELDSLSDLVSFGIAPIVIAWKVTLFDMQILGYIIAIIFPLAGAFRLARYNITSFNNVFSGVPITVAGAFLSIISLYNCFAKIDNKYTNFHSYITAGVIILLSFLMVSKIKIKKR